MHSLISWIAVILYALAVVSLVAALQGMVMPRRGERLALFMAVLAVPLHAAALWQGLWTAAGVNLALYNALSLLGWVMVTMLLLATLRQPVQSLGLVVFPFAAISAGLAGALGTPAPTLVPIGARWIGMWSARFLPTRYSASPVHRPCCWPGSTAACVAVGLAV